MQATYIAFTVVWGAAFLIRLVNIDVTETCKYPRKTRCVKTVNSLCQCKSALAAISVSISSCSQRGRILKLCRRRHDCLSILLQQVAKQNFFPLLLSFPSTLPIIVQNDRRLRTAAAPTAYVHWLLCQVPCRHDPLTGTASAVLAAPATTCPS